MLINERSGKNVLPWWTWIAPLLVLQLGSQLLMWLKADQDSSLWYLTTSFGIVMVFWWGPRVLVSVYCNALIYSCFWNSPWQIAPIYALPETLQVALSWILLQKVVKGKYWMPDLNNMILFFIFGSLIPALTMNLYLSTKLIILRDAPAKVFWDSFLVLFTSNIASQLIVVVPLLVYGTAFMKRRKLLVSIEAGYKIPVLKRQRSLPDITLFVTALIFILVLNLFFKGEQIWPVYGIILPTIALRYGIYWTVITSGWIGMVSFFMHDVIRNFSGRVAIAQSDMVNINLGIVLLCVTGNITGRTISDRRKILENIKSSLKEKEILLREIHHRVKNNLAVVSAFLDLQVANIDDHNIKEAFMESQNRIRSIALVHEQLYKSKDFAHMDVREYLEGICQNLYQTYGVSPEVVKSTITTDAIVLDIELLIPIGLLLNEFISNSFKHAFVGIDEPEITVTMLIQSATDIVFEYRDNGIGFTFGSDTKTKTLGLEIIRALVKQLQGKLDFYSENGVQYIITFKI